MGFFDLFSDTQTQTKASEKIHFGGGGTLVGIRRRSQNDYFLKGYLPYIALTFCAWMAADLTATYLRSYMIPSTPPAGQKQIPDMAAYKARLDYNDITTRNIFNSDGIIPEIKGSEIVAEDTGVARESSLPLNLVGTIVHANPGKSVAVIEHRGETFPCIIGWKIPTEDEHLATVLKIERRKLFFRNQQSGATEYIQLKDTTGLVIEKAVTQEGPVQKEGDNTFVMNRVDLESQMQDLPSFLTQARGVLNFTNGKPDGFKIVDVVPNSLIAKLGIKDNDVIKGVDGEPVNSLGKVMELYNGLRNRSSVKLTVDRNGKSMTMTYNIR